MLLLVACGGDDEATSPAAPPLTEEIAENEPAPEPTTEHVVTDAAREPDVEIEPPEDEAEQAGDFDARAAIASDDPEQRTDGVLDLDPENAEDLDVILRVASEDPDVGVREAAVMVLGDVDDRRAADALVLALVDADRRIVLAAVEALAFSEDTRAQAELERLAHSSDSEIAAAAQDAVGER